MRWIKGFLILAVAAICIVLILFIALFSIYPRVDYTVPLAQEQPDYEIRTIDGVPLLIEGGLPYPTDFDTATYPAQDLGGRWKMRFDDAEVGTDEGWEKTSLPDENWTDTTVPSTYNYYDGPYSKHAGVVWFIRTFVPARDADGDSFARLCFSGVLLRSQIWLNGQYIGDHEGGYTPFYNDVTDRLIPGAENVLVVRTDNRLTFESLPAKSWNGHTPGWGFYGGIYRDVALQWLPRTYICKAAVTPSADDDRGTVAVDLVVHNYGTDTGYTISGVVTGPDGRSYLIAPEACAPTGEYDVRRVSVDVDSPSPWSPDSPALYALALTVDSGGARETLTTKIGFRTVEAAGNRLLLNGEPVFLRGISKHEDDPKLGATLTPEIIDRDLDLILGMEANFIRLAHYPHDVRELHACRDRGIMVSEEIPFYKLGIGWAEWYQEKKGLLEFPVSTFGMRQLNDLTLMAIAQRQLIEMVERDRNNPAVIMWLVANETYTLFADGGRYHGWMRDVVRYFDDTRPVTMAEQTYDKPLLDDNRRSADFMDVASLNTYFGWYYDTYRGLDAHLNRFHERYPERPIFLTEFGAEAGPGRHDSDGVWVGERVRPGKTYSEDYQDEVIRGYIEIARTKDYVVGVCPWVFADFWDPWFPSNPMPDHNTKGVMSRDRVPKKSYYSLKELYTAIKESR